MKFLFVFNTPGFLRYFDTTIEGLLEEGHEVALVFQRPDLRASEIEVLNLENPRLTIVDEFRTRSDKYAELASGVRSAADYIRYLDPEFEDLEYLRNRQRARALRAAPQVARFGDSKSISGTQARTIVRLLLACERAIPSSREIEQYLVELAPDAVLVSPLVTAGSPQTDYVKSAQALGIPAGLCVASWDNLTNKGLMRLTPDRVFVWNEEQAKEAVEYHKVPRKRVVLTGAQPFDRWFGREPRESREAFCAKVGLDPQRAYVIFVGSSSNIARDNVEESFVRSWIEELRGSDDPLLRGVGVLVRPHPDRRGEWGAVDLEGLENVTLYPPQRPDSSIAPDTRADYFDSLHHSAAVVGINTSAMIEGAIIGRPVLTIRAPEFEESQRGTIHFRYLLPENGGFLLAAKDFPEHARQVAEAIRDPQIARELNERFVGSFIRPRGIEQPCTPILVDELEQFAQAGRRRARLRPTLYPLRGVLAVLVSRSKRRSARRDAIARKGARRAGRLQSAADRVRGVSPALAARLERKAAGVAASAKEQHRREKQQRRAAEHERSQRSKEVKRRGRDLLEQGAADRKETEELNV